MVGWSGGRVAGKAEIITNSAQLGLGLGLSLAKTFNVKSCSTSSNRPINRAESVKEYGGILRDAGVSYNI